jgi:hypothetical protein
MKAAADYMPSAVAETFNLYAKKGPIGMLTGANVPAYIRRPFYRRRYHYLEGKT